MEEHVEHVMGGGIGTEQLAIEHMRKRGYRVPIISVAAGQSPPNSIGCKTRHDRTVLVDIIIVIKIDELMVQGLTENDPNNCRQEYANADN